MDDFHDNASMTGDGERKYDIHYTKNYSMGVCSDGLYQTDIIYLTERKTHEELSLEFRQDTRKLLRVDKSRGLDFHSCKKFSPEQNSWEAIYIQYDMEPESPAFHEIWHDPQGRITKDYHSAGMAKNYYALPDEQPLMKKLQTSLEAFDDTNSTNDFKRQKGEILGYLKTNIQPDGNELRPGQGLGI